MLRPLRFPFHLSALALSAILVLAVACQTAPAAQAPQKSAPASSQASASPSAKSAPVEMEVGESFPGLTLNVPPAIAVAKELDAAQGIKLVRKKFTSGAALVEAVAAGSLQIGSAGDTPALSLLAGGTPTKIIALQSDSGRTYALYAAKELNIQKPEDLQGQTIALTFGSVSQQMFIQMVKLFNLDESKFKLIDMQPADIVTAYKKGDIQVFFAWQPAGYNASQVRPTDKLLDAYTSYFKSKPGPMNIYPAYTVYIARDDYIKQHPDLVKKYLLTMEKANEFLGNTDAKVRAEAVDIIATDTKMPKEVVQEGLDQVKFKLTVDEKLLKDLYDNADSLYKSGKFRNAPEPLIKNWINVQPLKEAVPAELKVTP